MMSREVCLHKSLSEKSLPRTPHSSAGQGLQRQKTGAKFSKSALLGSESCEACKKIKKHGDLGLKLGVLAVRSLNFRIGTK
jgi:hypothetical protein